MQTINVRNKIEDLKTSLYSAFHHAHSGHPLLKSGNPKAELVARVNTIVDRLIEVGRVSVLQDFDDVIQADGFMDFTEDEWSAIRRFFEFNKAVSGWSK